MAGSSNSMEPEAPGGGPNVTEEEPIMASQLSPVVEQNGTSRESAVPSDCPGAFCVQQRIEQLLHSIQPNKQSEFRRLTIANYVINLIKSVFHSGQVEAFMFGSVPLRTYLPDGDIDISVFSSPPSRGAGGEAAAGSPGVPSLRDTWANQLLRALEAEQSRPDAPFRIRDLQVIQAEVKLVKCVVADLVVDVSFETLGGLCTVAFLESIDRKIGHGHLFKRSIVLVKAWCYYESRLLGAHHGLISSYALEAMVLYVFNLHHQEVTTPMEVLCKFLEVFSTFNWDEYCLSLQGPIPLNTFPNPVVDTHGLDPSSLLLDPPFLEDVLSKYSVQPTHGGPPPPAHFVLKHLNIVDPLLPSNNLGRSVSKASYARIRRAFAHGAHSLSGIMRKEPRSAIEGIDLFFRNTWKSPMRMAADNLAFMQRLGLGNLPFQIPFAPAYSAAPAARSGSNGATEGLGAAALPTPPGPVPQQQQVHAQPSPPPPQVAQALPPPPPLAPPQQPQQVAAALAQAQHSQQAMLAQQHAAATPQRSYLQLLSDAVRQQQQQQQRAPVLQPLPLQQQLAAQLGGSGGGGNGSSAQLAARSQLEALAQSLQLLQMQQQGEGMQGSHAATPQYTAAILGRPHTTPPLLLAQQQQQLAVAAGVPRGMQRRHSSGTLLQLGDRGIGGASDLTSSGSLRSLGSGGLSGVSSPAAISSLLAGSSERQPADIPALADVAEAQSALPSSQQLPTPVTAAPGGGTPQAAEEGVGVTEPEDRLSPRQPLTPASQAPSAASPESSPQQPASQALPGLGARPLPPSAPGSPRGERDSGASVQERTPPASAPPQLLQRTPPLPTPGRQGQQPPTAPALPDVLSVLLPGGQLHAAMTAPNTPTTPHYMASAAATAGGAGQGQGQAATQQPRAQQHMPGKGAPFGQLPAGGRVGMLGSLATLTPYQLQQVLALQPQLLQQLLASSPQQRQQHLLGSSPLGSSPDAGRAYGMPYYVGMQGAGLGMRPPPSMGPPDVDLPRSGPLQPPPPQPQQAQQQQPTLAPQQAQQQTAQQAQQQSSTPGLSPAASGEVPALGTDIFTGDLLSLSQNLDTARSCQVQDKAGATPGARSPARSSGPGAGGGSMAASPLGPRGPATGGASGGGIRPAPPPLPVVPATGTASSSPRDTVDAARAALPQLRTSSAADEAAESSGGAGTAMRSDSAASTPKLGSAGQGIPQGASPARSIAASSSAASTPTGEAIPPGRRSWSDIAASRGSGGKAALAAPRIQPPPPLMQQHQELSPSAPAQAQAAQQAQRESGEYQRPLHERPLQERFLAARLEGRLGGASSRAGGSSAGGSKAPSLYGGSQDGSEGTPRAGGGGSERGPERGPRRLERGRQSRHASRTELSSWSLAEEEFPSLASGAGPASSPAPAGAWGAKREQPEA